MPQGKGTYGSKRGRPPARAAKQSQEEARSGSGSIPFKDLKSGALRRQLKVGQGKGLTKTEMGRVTKIADGERFTFRNKEIKMTPLLKKRAVLARSMLGFKKK